MKMLVLLSFLTIVLYGCATTNGENLHNIQLGMSKPEVIKIMGKPSSMSAKGHVEYMRYNIGVSQLLSDSKGATYFIRLVNGEVDSYGEEGDFDSTKTPTLRIETDKK